VITKAVIFDYDGVIVNSLNVVFGIYREISRKLHKIEFKTPQELADSFDGDWKNLYARLGITNESEETIASRIYAETITVSMASIPVIAGMPEVVQSLAQKYALGIVTNTQKAFIVDKLKESRLTDCFRAIVDYQDTPKRKPEPDQIIECMRRLEAKPEEAVYIGDMDGDMIAGRRAGAKVIGVTWGWHKREKLEQHKPDIIVESPQELAGAIP